jgi:hypothetical protein
MIFGNNRFSLRFLEAGKRCQLGAVIGMAGTDGRQDNHSGIAVTTILDFVLGRLLLIIRQGVLPSRRLSQSQHPFKPTPLLFPDGSALQDASPEFYIAWAGKAVGARLNRTVSRRPAISFYITSGSVQPSSGAMVAGWLSGVPRRHGPDKEGRTISRMLPRQKKIVKGRASSSRGTPHPGALV